MAKPKHSNFLDTVDKVSNNEIHGTLLHVYIAGDPFHGNTIRGNKKQPFHFGTTSDLGLEKYAHIQTPGKYSMALSHTKDNNGRA